MPKTDAEYIHREKATLNDFSCKKELGSRMTVIFNSHLTRVAWPAEAQLG